MISGAEGIRDCGRLGAPGPYVDMCLGFGVETGRVVVWLCLGSHVRGTGDAEENDQQGVLGTLGQMDVFGLYLGIAFVVVFRT